MTHGGAALKCCSLAIEALASSAPILQFDDITPWSSFYDAISQDFKDASLNCYEVIKGSWAELNLERWVWPIELNFQSLEGPSLYLFSPELGMVSFCLHCHGKLLN